MMNGITINYIKFNNNKYIIIDYDDFHKKNILEQQIFIQELLEEIIPKDLLKINKDVSLLKKQDTSTDYSTKIIELIPDILNILV